MYTYVYICIYIYICVCEKCQRAAIRESDSTAL